MLTHFAIQQMSKIVEEEDSIHDEIWWIKQPRFDALIPHQATLGGVITPLITTIRTWTRLRERSRVNHSSPLIQTALALDSFGLWQKNTAWLWSRMSNTQWRVYCQAGEWRLHEHISLISFSCLRYAIHQWLFFTTTHPCIASPLPNQTTHIPPNTSTVAYINKPIFQPQKRQQNVGIWIDYVKPIVTEMPDGN